MAPKTSRMTMAVSARAGAYPAQRRGEGRLDMLAETLGVELLVGEGLHGADRVQALVGVGRDVGRSALVLARAACAPAGRGR